MIGVVGVCIIVGAVIVAAGVGIGMTISASKTADATKYAADRQAEAQKFSAEQQRAAQDHEADLLFKTEQADRELSVQFNDKERSEEAQMMRMFGMVDDIQTEESTRVDRRGSRGSGQSVDVWGDYEYPQPISDDEMSFS